VHHVGGRHLQVAQAGKTATACQTCVVGHSTATPHRVRQEYATLQLWDSRMRACRPARQICQHTTRQSG
jgi:hypothetical protein